jgi:hypothetical protein
MLTNHDKLEEDLKEVGAVSVTAFLSGHPAFYRPNEKTKHLDQTKCLESLGFDDIPTTMVHKFTQKRRNSNS